MNGVSRTQLIEIHATRTVSGIPSDGVGPRIQSLIHKGLNQPAEDIIDAQDNRGMRRDVKTDRR